MADIYANQNTSTLAVNNHFFYDLEDELSFMPEEIHEVRWNGTDGEIRYDDGRLEIVTELENEDTYISVFNTLRAAELAAKPVAPADGDGWEPQTPVPEIELFDVDAFLAQWNTDHPLNPLAPPENPASNPTTDPNLTFEQISANFRKARNNLLTNSDWTQLSNSPLTDAKKAEWEAYRVQLRNAPVGISTTLWQEMADEDNSNWPTKPS